MTGRPRPAAGPRPGPVVRRVLVPRTRFGPVGIAWAERGGRPKVVRVLLSRPGAPADRQLARAGAVQAARWTRIADGKGNKVFRQLKTTSEFGIASADFQLASEVNLGTTFKVYLPATDKPVDTHIDPTVEPGSLQALALNNNVDRLNQLLFSHCEYAVKGIRP